MTKPSTKEARGYGVNPRLYRRVVALKEARPDLLEKALHKEISLRKAEHLATHGDARKYVYFIQAKGQPSPIKIGCSYDPDRRLRELQKHCPVELVLIGLIPGDQDKEAELHRRFKHLRSHGEWFHAFDDLVDFIEASKAA